MAGFYPQAGDVVYKVFRFSILTLTLLPHIYLSFELHGVDFPMKRSLPNRPQTKRPGLVPSSFYRSLMIARTPLISFDK